MTRCFLENCKQKLTRYNTYRLKISGENDTFTDKTKIMKICDDCARLYFGIYYESSDGKFIGSGDAVMEFVEEFNLEIDASLDKKFARRPPQSK